MFNWAEIEVKKRKSVFRRACRDESLSQEQRTKLLKNIYEGLECVCLATGRSLLEFSKDKIDSTYSDVPVFSIKMAAVRHQKLTDVCISNFYNSFDFEGELPFLFLARQETPLSKPNWVNGGLVDPETFLLKFTGAPDIMWGCDNSVLHSRSVCNANRWEENTLDKQPVNRILGPGVLNDMGFPIMMHTGVSKIKILGWDGSVVGEDGKVEHFYDLEEEFRPTMNALRRDLNLNILKADLTIDEQQIVRNSEGDINNFLLNNGIIIEILTENSHVSSAVKRNLELYS